MQASRLIGDPICHSREIFMTECSPVFVFDFCLIKKPEKQPGAQYAPRTHPKIQSTNHGPLYF